MGNQVVLTFDCVALGTHEIQTSDSGRLNKVLDRLSKRIDTPVSKIREVCYNYTPLNRNCTISQLGLKSGSVLLVKFADLY